jgi:hypothetical protein
MKYSEERSFSRAAYYMNRLQDYVQKRVDASKTREERREAIHAKMDVQSVMHILKDYFFLKNGSWNIPEWHPNSLNEIEPAKED